MNDDSPLIESSSVVTVTLFFYLSTTGQTVVTMLYLAMWSDNDMV